MSSTPNKPKNTSIEDKYEIILLKSNRTKIKNEIKFNLVAFIIVFNYTVNALYKGMLF